MNADSTLVSLFIGLLLMTSPIHTLNASDSQAKGQTLVTDFTANSSDLAWYVVNDNVMGGRSEGDFQQLQGELIFSGSTNTNGGGFSSIRTGPLQLDLSDHDGIRAHLKGDGRRYTWLLMTNASWRGRPVSYRADFETHKGAWSTVDMPFASFTPGFRGYQLDGPLLDSKRITGMGLMIYDQRDGSFKLHMASVHAYSAK